MTASQPSDNRRVFYRLPIQLPLRYRVVGERQGPWLSGRTINLSAGGLLLQGPMIDDPDQDALLMGYRSLEIQLELPSGRSLSLRGGAAWMEDGDPHGGRLNIGVEFEHPCPVREELQAFVQGCCDGGRPAVQ